MQTYNKNKPKRIQTKQKPHKAKQNKAKQSKKTKSKKIIDLLLVLAKIYQSFPSIHCFS